MLCSGTKEAMYNVLMIKLQNNPRHRREKGAHGDRKQQLKHLKNLRWRQRKKSFFKRKTN